MLIKCPHHDIPEHTQLYIFYLELKLSSRNVIDAAEGGSVMGKTIEEALKLLNEISENAIQWPSEHIIIKKAATVNQVDALNILTQYIISLAQKFETFQVNTQQPSQCEACDMCGGNHQNHECQATNHNYEHVNVIDYKQYPFGSLMVQKYLGFQWSNPNGAENSQSFQKQQIQGLPEYQNPNMVNQTLDLINKQGPISKGLNKLIQKRFKVPYQAIQRKTQKSTLRPSPYSQEILSSKRKLEEVSMVMLTEKCSAILQNKLPQKLGDPDSFTIPCTFGGVYFEKALCDSGASINLMSFSIFKKLDLGEIKDTSVSL
ncbi:uncharacterized protein [Nicotiana sylvestris]|uniref:uncharacterized protein n=1 Tax=Nicotiana sylvestris TaxID=4096 RepID=UPI00388C44A3